VESQSGCFIAFYKYIKILTIAIKNLASPNENARDEIHLLIPDVGI
jgi:hypothetical protein